MILIAESPSRRTEYRRYLGNAGSSKTRRFATSSEPARMRCASSSSPILERLRRLIGGRAKSCDAERPVGDPVPALRVRQGRLHRAARRQNWRSGRAAWARGPRPCARGSIRGVAASSVLCGPGCPQPPCPRDRRCVSAAPRTRRDRLAVARRHRRAEHSCRNSEAPACQEQMACPVLFGHALDTTPTRTKSGSGSWIVIESAAIPSTSLMIPSTPAASAAPWLGSHRLWSDTDPPF